MEPQLQAQRLYEGTFKKRFEWLYKLDMIPICIYTYINNLDVDKWDLIPRFYITHLDVDDRDMIPITT